ncbi:MAG: methyl-accepting chemotaxis protein [Spirochaetaceae bacterium]|nr:methyl-accepting chemotaxis protein [Spirochaetaceae bacterium]
MKLNAKFSFLILGLIAVVVFVNVTLIKQFNQFLEVKNYELSTKEAITLVNKLGSYNDAIYSRKFTISTVADEWKTTLASADEIINFLQTAPILKSIPSDITRGLTFGNELWVNNYYVFGNLTQQYERLAAQQLNFNLKLYIETNGLEEGIYKAKEADLDTANLEAIKTNISNSQGNIITVIQEYSSFLDGFSNNISEYTQNHYNNLIVTFYITVILSCIFIFLAAMVITRAITRRIKALQKVSKSLLQKDLTVQAKIKGKDEVEDLAKDLNITIQELEAVIQHAKEAAKEASESGDTIRNSATQTAAATHQIKTNIESLRRQFSNLDESVEDSIKKLMKMSDVAVTLVVDNNAQSSSIEDNTKDIRDITTTIQQISVTSSKRAENAKDIQKFVADGDEKINATAEVLGEVTAKLDEIGEIVSIINAIAEQTNILSMNAAIESAHAGDAGRGFAVVAEEIRGLAESTSENAKRIAASVSGIVEKVNSADKASALAAESFTQVGQQTHNIIASLNAITNDIQQVEKKISVIDKRTADISDSAKKISEYCDTFTQEQNAVSEAMAQMHNIFSEAKTGVEEIAAGSTDIVNRTLEVTEFSNITCEKMQTLASTMEEFITSSNSDTINQIDETSLDSAENQDITPEVENLDYPIEETISNLDDETQFTENPSEDDFLKNVEEI